MSTLSFHSIGIFSLTHPYVVVYDVIMYNRNVDVNNQYTTTDNRDDPDINVHGTRIDYYIIRREGLLR